MRNSKKMNSKKMNSKKMKSKKRKVLAKGKSNNSINRNVKTVKSINYKTMFPFNCKHCQMRYKTKLALQLHKKLLDHKGKPKKKKITSLKNYNNSNNVFDKGFHN